jgi:hypothetical protein
MIAIFINSEGCKLIKYKLIHLCDPEALMPYKEAQTRKNKTTT